MSDFFLSTADVDRALVDRELRFTDRTKVESGHVAGLTWAISRVDDFALWGTAWDPASQTRVLLGGRIALEEAEWAAAERLPFQGGLAGRHLLSRWLSGGAGGVSEYNGAALVAIIDERQREAHVWTDRMGFYPAFATERGEMIASHPDVLARLCAAGGPPLTIDEVTIAEFLRTGTSVFPYTYWREVRHLACGRRFHLNLRDASTGLRECETYWQPAFLNDEPPLTRGACVEALAQAFRNAGRRRSCTRLGRTALLLSAGADSRGVLASMRAPSQVDCYTYFDEPNQELRSAEKIAALAGARHFALQRAADYYVVNAAETVRLSGGMWSMESGHHAGFADEIQRRSNPGTLLTGDYCDFLFKGIGLNRRQVKLFGRNLPLYQLSSYRHDFYFEHAPLAPHWARLVSDRLEERYPVALQKDADQRKVEFLRAAPLSRDDAACAHLTLWRLAPFDFFIADSDILDIYGRMSIVDKISGIAFGQAISLVTGPRIASVPNNNFGAPVGTTEARRVTSFLMASATRKLRGAISRTSDDSDSVATPGSWPDLAKVALKSPVMRAWFEDSARRETLFSYIHPDRRNWSLEQFAAHDVFQLYRLITVDLWLRNVIKTPASSTRA